MSRSVYLIERVLAVVAAIILLQTLYFKFSGHPDSVYIFTKMGVEPYGRIGLGILELLTAILLVFPKTSHLGALIGIGIMLGAVFSHLFILGLNVNEDGGTLFFLAVSVLLCCLGIVYIKKDKIFALVKKR